MASYVLDRHSAVRHVATRLWRADPDGPALTVADLAGSLNKHIGFNHADLARIRKYEHRRSNYDALVWLIQEALCLLGDQVAPDGHGGYRLARPFAELRYNGRALVPDDLTEEQALPRPAPIRDPRTQRTAWAQARRDARETWSICFYPEERELHEKLELLARKEGFTHGHNGKVNRQAVLKALMDKALREGIIK